MFFQKKQIHFRYLKWTVIVLLAAALIGSLQLLHGGGKHMGNRPVLAAKHRIAAKQHSIPDEVYIRRPAVLSPKTALGGRKVDHKLFKGIKSIDFTFGVLPDTQFYSRSHPDIFKKMNLWFVKNKQALNLQYIFHLGDIVNNFDQPYQWKTADRSMRILDQAMLPYGIITGNHDVGYAADYRPFYRYFSESRYRWNPWYGGSYKNNKGHFDLVDVDGKKYIMVAMGWGISGDEVAWMNDVLRLYSDRTAILYVHDYLNGQAQRTLQGQMLFNRVVRPNPNVKIVMNGHCYGAARKIDAIDDNLDGKPDRKVMQILSDYQSVKGGQGYIRVIGFDLKHDKVYVRTFSPQVGRTHAFKKNHDNFAFRFDIDSSRGKSVVQKTHQKKH
ncbi:MAG: metallophosphoesterase [Sporolactobacillus sp.]